MLMTLENCRIKASPGRYRDCDYRLSFGREPLAQRRVFWNLCKTSMSDNSSAAGDLGCVDLVPRTSVAHLTLVREDHLPELRKLLIDSCDRLNDPYRASQLLTDTYVRKRIYIAAPDHARLEGLRTVAMAAQILVVYSIWPGRSSYSVFVEDCPAAAPGDSSSGRVTVQPGDHRNHLFVAALRGILALPPPHGPGRLAFSAIPGYAAPAMKAVLREAGYGEVWDEGCFRYWIRELPGENWGVGGERGSRRVEVQPPGPDCAESGKRKGCEHTYVLDELRSEADACLVNSLWTYRSPYSLPLVRILVAHRHTACVRLQKNDDDDDGPAGPVGPATDTPPPAGAAGDTRGDGFGSESASAEVGSTSDAVAWILQYPDGSIGMAHTLPPHRRRGLMKRCVREVAERVLGWKRQGGSGGSRSASSEVFTYIVEGNTASIALFEGLGFQRSAERYHWFGAEGVEPAEGGLVVEGQGQQTVRP